VPVHLPFKKLPTRHLRVQPEQSLAYTPLSVHSAVAHWNGSGRTAGATAVFVLLRITGDFCYIHVVFSITVPRLVLTPRCASLPTSFLGFYNPLVPATRFNLAAVYRSRTS
jgi:hypothetical protein